MKAGGLTWWAGKSRQFRAHVVAGVASTERASLDGWLKPAQIAVFDGMTVADRRHGLDVVAALRLDGVVHPDVLIAGLLHDAGKGATGLWPRVIHSLGQAYGSWIPAVLTGFPGMVQSLERLSVHAETSARMAEDAGCSPRTIELIRWQEAPRDPEYGERLRLADEAN